MPIRTNRNALPAIYARMAVAEGRKNSPGHLKFSTWLAGSHTECAQLRSSVRCLGVRLGLGLATTGGERASSEDRLVLPVASL